MKVAFPPIVDSKSKILILGTMPGEQSLKLQQYYGNRGNHFWKLIFTILDATFTEDYTIRTQLLQQNHIALWDVLAYCEREGSLDSNIKNAAVNDFDAFHQSYPDIETVFFSSKNAALYYEKLYGLQTSIAYFTLPSPSGANATKTFLQKLEEWKMICEFL